MICICVFVLENIFKTAAYKLKDKEENRIRTRQQAKKKKKKSYDMNQIAISWEKFFFPTKVMFLNLSLPYCAVCHLP